MVDASTPTPTPPPMTTTTATTAATAAPETNGGIASASTAPEAAPSGERCLAEMNASFAKCLSLVCPPIQYPPHCRFNPVQQDAADLSEIETRLEAFFLHAKQIELLFLEDTTARSEGIAAETSREELELEIYHLESELNEKNDLIEKYADVVRGWEGKFKRLGSRLAPERE